MKKLLSFFLIPVLAIALLTGCPGDDDDNGSKNPLVGQWQITEVESKGILTEPESLNKSAIETPWWAEECVAQGWIRFDADGKYTEKDVCNNATYNGTWVRNNDDLVVSISNPAASMSIKILELTASTLKCNLWVQYNSSTKEEFEFTYEKVK